MKYAAFIVALAGLLSVAPVFAGEDDIPIKIEDFALESKRFVHDFELDKSAKALMTVGCSPMDDRKAMSLSVRVYHTDERGNQTELKQYAVNFTKQIKSMTGKMSLKPGRYRIVVTAEWSRFNFQLDNAKR